MVGLLSKSSSHKHDSYHKAFCSVDKHVLLIMMILEVLNLPMKEQSYYFSFWNIVHRSVSEAPFSMNILHKNSWQLVRIVDCVLLQSRNQLKLLLPNSQWRFGSSQPLALHRWSSPHSDAKTVIWAWSLFSIEFWVWCLGWGYWWYDLWTVSYAFLLWLCPLWGLSCCQWNINCIIWNLVRVHATFCLRLQISLSGFTASLSGIDPWMLPNLLIPVEAVRSPEMVFHGFLGAGASRLLIQACCSAWIWVICSRSYRACCLVVSCWPVHWTKTEKHVVNLWIPRLIRL